MIKVLLTCEHGGNAIPPEYNFLFNGKEELLNTHEGYDIGALELFQELRNIADIGFYAETTRLLIDLNRSINHKKLFSSVTRALPEAEKQKIIKAHYTPYRNQVEQLVEDFISAGRSVLHISVHSFTPVLDGEERTAAIGLLYDSKRKEEQSFCRKWKKELIAADNTVTVRYNYPYLGTADGFPTYLRRKFTHKDYFGIELEVNQKYNQQHGKEWQHLISLLKTTLLYSLKSLQKENP